MLSTVTERYAGLAVHRPRGLHGAYFRVLIRHSGDKLRNNPETREPAFSALRLVAKVFSSAYRRSIPTRFAQDKEASVKDTKTVGESQMVQHKPSAMDVHSGLRARSGQLARIRVTSPVWVRLDLANCEINVLIVGLHD